MIWMDIIILYIVVGLVHGAYLAMMAFDDLFWEELLIAVGITVICWPWIWVKWAQGFIDGMSGWRKNYRDRN